MNWLNTFRTYHYVLNLDVRWKQPLQCWEKMFFQILIISWSFLKGILHLEDENVSPRETIKIYTVYMFPTNFSDFMQHFRFVRIQKCKNMQKITNFNGIHTMNTPKSIYSDQRIRISYCYVISLTIFLFTRKIVQKWQKINLVHKPIKMCAKSIKTQNLR